MALPMTKDKVTDKEIRRTLPLRISRIISATSRRYKSGKGGRHCQCTKCEEFPDEHWKDANSELWICVGCGHAGCNRYTFGGAKEHFRMTGHPIAICICTDAVDDNSWMKEQTEIWDYEQDEFLKRICRTTSSATTQVVAQSTLLASDLDITSRTGNRQAVGKRNAKTTTRPLQPRIDRVSPEDIELAKERVAMLEELVNLLKAGTNSHIIDLERFREIYEQYAQLELQSPTALMDSESTTSEDVAQGVRNSVLSHCDKVTRDQLDAAIGIIFAGPATLDTKSEGGNQATRNYTRNRDTLLPIPVGNHFGDTAKQPSWPVGSLKHISRGLSSISKMLARNPFLPLLAFARQVSLVAASPVPLELDFLPALPLDPWTLGCVVGTTVGYGSVATYASSRVERRTQQFAIFALMELLAFLCSYAWSDEQGGQYMVLISIFLAMLGFLLLAMPLKKCGGCQKCGRADCGGGCGAGPSTGTDDRVR